MAKSRNNLLGVGGQRKKLSRAEQHGTAQGRASGGPQADDRKQDLLKKMRERSTRRQEADEQQADGQQADEQQAGEQQAGGQESAE
ncbi:DUF6243 family protein [Streptomyces sp. NPDC048717]|uniref:DUF6243 family protein n=1 Tax=Streptomyces sp. NPDC048717 TaxID=3154928 RepID=UPI0034194485